MTSPEQPLDWTPRAQPLGPPAAPVAGPAAYPPAYGPPPALPKKRRTGLIIGLVVAVLLLAGGGTVLYLGLVPGTADPKAGALHACQEAVKAVLKAPATAKFSGDQVEPVSSWYRVSGFVDAENGFSALIRNRYTCVATQGVDGWQTSGVDVTS